MNPLDQLLRDAMTEHTEAVPHLRSGSARRALVSSRRRQRLTMAAAGSATVAVTLGVGAVALNAGPATSTKGGVGGPGSGHSATAKDPVSAKGAVLAPANRTARASAAPKATTTAKPLAGGGHGLRASSAGKGESEADAPAELRAITLAGPIAGLTITPTPSTEDGGAPYYERSANGTWTKWYWFAPTGRSEVLGSAGAVIITEGVSRPLWNQAQSPSPAVSSTTVNQRPGTVWLSGGDREIYYTASAFTVEVFVGDGSVSVDQMKAIGDAVQGLPQ